MLSFYLSALESAADKEDFRALYRRYHGVMERTALAILQDPRDAEEAGQISGIGNLLIRFCRTRAMRRRPCRRLLSG